MATDSRQEHEALLKVGNYQSNIFEAINEAKDYISRNDCRYLSIDIAGLNLIDALKVCVLSSTFHFAKYSGGKIKWIVKDNLIKEQIELLKLDNVEITLKHSKRNYVDFSQGFVRNLSICR